MTAFQTAGLLTHAVVLGLGLGAIAGRVPLQRGRRGGVGLVLMALSMVVLFTRPRHFGAELVAALGHVLVFGVALWLLVGPVPPAPGGPAGGR